MYIVRYFFRQHAPRPLHQGELTHNAVYKQNNQVFINVAYENEP